MGIYKKHVGKNNKSKWTQNFVRIDTLENTWSRLNDVPGSIFQMDRKWLIWFCFV